MSLEKQTDIKWNQHPLKAYKSNPVAAQADNIRQRFQ